MTPHQIRRFPENVDFLTSAGQLGGHNERQNLNLMGEGPTAVVTDIGILEPDQTGELILTALHPGKNIEQAKENTGWLLQISEDLTTTDSLSNSELSILHEDLDPKGIYVKK